MPDIAIVQSFLNNALLLFTLVLIQGSMTVRIDHARIRNQIFIGFVIGFIGLFIMLSPWTVTEGIFYDTRTVLISVTGAFFGWIPTILVTLITAVYRIFHGGDGIYAGLLSILFSAGFGLILHEILRKKRYQIHSNLQFILTYLVFGFIVNVAMLLSQYAIINTDARLIIQQVWMPVLIINPLATAILAYAMKNHLMQLTAIEDIRRSQTLLSAGIEGPKTLWILAVDNQMRYLFFNSAHRESMQRMYGKTIQVGDSFIQQLDAAEGQKAAEESLIRALKGEHFYTVDRYGMEQHRVLQTFFSPIRDHQNTIIGAITFTLDITRETEQAQQLEASEHELNNLIKAMSLGLVSFRVLENAEGSIADFQISRFNPQFASLFQLSQFTEGETLLHLFPDLKPEWFKILQQVAQTGQATELDVYVEAMNKHFFFSAYTPVKGELALIVSDVTEQKAYEDRILYLSYHDYLTGLYNRRYYMEQMDLLNTKESLPLTLVLFDINGLKLVNDAFGHFEGDRVINQFAQLLQREFRDTDVVARIGGDEFVILMPNSNRSIVEPFLHRLNQQASRISSHGIQVSASYGIATRHHLSVTMSELHNEAEKEMYYKKLYELSSQRSEAIKTILTTLHLKSRREELHSFRVSELCQEMGRAYNLSVDEVKQLSVIGNLHDIGKIAVDTTILDKPGRLNDWEWEEMKKHPETGYRILSASAEYAPIAQDILCHHERWDGTGYPQGLKGNDIPWRARVIALADAYDAMTGERPYRKSLTEKEAVAEIMRCAGSQFDPELAKTFVTKVLGRDWDPLIDKKEEN